mgnify:CR=1 FL=1
MAHRSAVQTTDLTMDDKPDPKHQGAGNTASGRGAALQKQRRTRQAQSLRDNLKKRKQQVRARDAGRKPEA